MTSAIGAADGSSAPHRAGSSGGSASGSATAGSGPTIATPAFEAFSSALTVRLIRDTGIATVIVDKNYAAVMALADRSVVIVKGRVVFAGESAELSGNHELMHRFLGV